MHPFMIGVTWTLIVLVRLENFCRSLSKNIYLSTLYIVLSSIYYLICVTFNVGKYACLSESFSTPAIFIKSIPYILSLSLSYEDYAINHLFLPFTFLGLAWEYQKLVWITWFDSSCSVFVLLFLLYWLFCTLYLE